MLVRGEVEDDVRLRGCELLLEPPRLADVAEDVLEEVERLRVTGAPVGDQRGLVPVDDRDPLRPEAAEERRKRAADRAAAAGEQDPAAAARAPARSPCRHASSPPTAPGRAR